MAEHTLPEQFETFSEARKNGFLAVKKIKDEGGLIAGTFCTFTPKEILDAAGISPVSLCGMSNETVPDAERDLPKNLCPLIKSSYGFAVSDKCPYTHFADILIGETTCDGKKKMYELLGKIKPMYVLQLPQGVDREYSLPLWTKELRRFRKVLEEKFNVTITDEKLRQAAKLRNEIRMAQRELMELNRAAPPAFPGLDLYKLMDGTGFRFNLPELRDMLRETVRQTKADYDAGKRPVPADAKRLLVTGCPIGGVLDKTVKVAEENGGVVVCFENCGGIKPLRHLVDTEAEDIIAAIAEHYLDIGCAVMAPNDRRIQLIRELVDEFQIEGVIEVDLQTCHPYTVETRRIKTLCGQLGIPYLAVDTDYSQADLGQLTTRISAFIEMM